MQSSRKQKINMPFDPNKTYKAASCNYLIQRRRRRIECVADNDLVIDEVTIDNQVLITFINEYLSGVIPA